jgi:hypothetical protein
VEETSQGSAAAIIELTAATTASIAIVLYTGHTIAPHPRRDQECGGAARMA